MAMAFVEIIDDTGVPFFCNVHAGVGQGQPNRHDDVMLVQWLLLQYFKVPGKISAPPGPLIKVDGMFGRQTADYIKAFQSGAKSKGTNIAADGYVHRARGVQGAATGAQYTIIHLNNAADNRRPELGRKFWVATDFPPVVQHAMTAASRR
jgi:hypothetical protein